MRKPKLAVHRIQGQTAQLRARRKGTLQLFYCCVVLRTRFHPVFMREQERGRRAFLAAAGVRVLVALPRDVVDVRYIRAQDLPVEAGILQPDLQGRGGAAEVADASL